jgi:cysteine desulfurase/selenocysteine lyase
VLEMMLGLGLDQIERRVLSLAAYGCEVLRRAGGVLLRDRLPGYDSPLLAARFERCDVSALAERLRACGVVVSARHGCLRVSPHFFNDESDLDRLGERLGESLVR